MGTSLMRNITDDSGNNVLIIPSEAWLNIPFILIFCLSFFAEVWGGDFFFLTAYRHILKFWKCSIPQFVSVFCWCLFVLLHSHLAEFSASWSKRSRRKDVHIPLFTRVYSWYTWLDCLSFALLDKILRLVFIYITAISLKLSFQRADVKKQVSV